LITASGQVIPRNKDELTRKYGTQHAIGIEEIDLLLKDDPEVIFIGLGQRGIARITSDAKTRLLKSRARIVEGPTPQVVKRFGSFERKKAGIFHVTC